MFIYSQDERKRNFNLANPPFRLNGLYEQPAPTIYYIYVYKRPAQKQRSDNHITTPWKLSFNM
jgi:hypothetical protein